MQVTHNGLDAMVRRVMAEMTLLTKDDPDDVTYEHPRYMAMTNIGIRDLYEGLQVRAPKSHYSGFFCSLHCCL